MKHWKDKSDFKEEVFVWAKKLKVKVHSLALRPMSNKWASCSTKGNLNFNEDLLSIDKELGIYVIVHELLHFHYPNHGPVWKSMMAHYLGNYDSLEKKLKIKAIPEKQKRKSNELTIVLTLLNKIK